MMVKVIMNFGCNIYQVNRQQEGIDHEQSWKCDGR